MLKLKHKAFAVVSDDLTELAKANFLPAATTRLQTSSWITNRMSSY